jgi:hypothetical protein
MRESLALYNVLPKANIDFGPVVKMRELLAFEKQGREPIVAPRPSALFNRELAESFTEACAE